VGFAFVVRFNGLFPFAPHLAPHPARPFILVENNFLRKSDFRRIRILCLAKYESDLAF
jgi:hypothetical protein